MDERLERLKGYIGKYAIQYRDIETTRHFYARGDEDFAWLISVLESAWAEIASLKSELAESVPVENIAGTAADLQDWKARAELLHTIVETFLKCDCCCAFCDEARAILLKHGKE